MSETSSQYSDNPESSISGEILDEILNYSMDESEANDLLFIFRELESTLDEIRVVLLRNDALDASEITQSSAAEATWIESKQDGELQYLNLVDLDEIDLDEKGNADLLNADQLDDVKLFAPYDSFEDPDLIPEFADDRVFNEPSDKAA